MRPWREWLRTYRSNERGEHYLANPGSQDITIDVPFDQLPEPDAFRSQSQFLQRWGIDDLVAEGVRVWTEQAARPGLDAMRMRSRVSEAEALLDPAGLGGFNVAECARLIGRRAGRRHSPSPATWPRLTPAGTQADAPHDTIDALSAENRKFPPSEEFKADALVVGTYLYDEAAQDDEAFWANQAAELDRLGRAVAHDPRLAAARRRAGSTAARSTCRTTASTAMCSPAHGDRVAFHWEGEPGDTRTITYAELLDEV